MRSDPRAHLAVALTLVVACVAGPARRAERGSPGEAGREGRGRGTVRVALATAAPSGRVGGTGGWRLHDGEARVLARGTAADDAWLVERRGRQLRAVRADGSPTPFHDGALIVRPDEPGAVVTWNAKRYRGDLAITATDRGLLVVNRLPVEDYLRGVVPLEIGANRTPAEHAAVEAQAVAARSYVYVRLGGSRSYDVVATLADQVYGGADAERPLTDAAVAATRGLVLTYGGRVVGAPYHSTCGGSTAGVSEVWWRESPQPYLRGVSDRIPGTARYYCEPSPTFTWTRSYDASSLSATLDRYLRDYAAVPAGGVGAARLVSMRGTTPSGRAAALRITTDRGSFDVRGNDIRYVLRSPGGEILNSTYFTVEPVVGADGHLRQLTVRGSGNGHGIGMCQWGAIGRARAGHDFRAILRAYYPGTVVAPAE